VLPQVVVGRPADRLPLLPYLLGKGVGPGPFSRQLPRRLRDRLLGAAYRGLVSLDLYGLPAPSGPPSAAGAVLAPHLLERLLHGRIALAPGIARFEGAGVRFEGGERVGADLVVWCLSGAPRYPFLPAAAAPGAEGEPEPLRSVFPKGTPDLAFVGLAEAGSGSPTAIAECQAELVAARLSGAYAPSRGRRTRVSSGPSASEFDYIWRVRRELRAGRRRARRRSR
jgi:hypothetical protein